MIIDIASIDTTRFNVRQFGNRTLVTRNKGLNYGYLPGEHRLRSLVLDTETGKVLSSGYPKFYNYGEDPTTDEAVNSAPVLVYAEKLDGTLIIYSPQAEGPPIVRTRGRIDLGDFHERVMPLVQAWEQNFDPLCEVSYLFEYTAPDNQIVLKYDQPELNLLAVVDHDTLDVYQHNGIPVMEDLPSLVAKIQAQSLDEGGEGIVVWVPGRDNEALHLCKIKTAEYLRLHRLKSNMTPARLAALIAVKQFTTEHEVSDYIIKTLAMDFECLDRSLVLEVLQRRAHAQQSAVAFEQVVNSLGWEASRKDIALAARAASEGDSGLFGVLMHWGVAHLSACSQEALKAEQAEIAYVAGVTYQKACSLAEVG